MEIEMSLQPLSLSSVHVSGSMWRERRHGRHQLRLLLTLCRILVIRLAVCRAIVLCQVVSSKLLTTYYARWPNERNAARQ